MPKQPNIPSNELRPELGDAFKEEAEDDGRYDERTTRRGAEDERGPRGIVEDAARVGDDQWSDAEYEALVRSEFEQTALPTPPAMPGWHLCWLTTTSNSDNISKRMRIGYRPVRIEELPGFDPSNGQTLQKFEGHVTCNEMVLCKIPERYFLQMMKYFHHTKPAEDQETTLERIKQGLEKEQDSSGRDLGEILGTGFLDMERTTKRSDRSPRFAT